MPDWEAIWECDTTSEIGYFILSFYKDIPHTSISDEFQVDLWVTCLNFQTMPRSNYLLIAKIPQELHALCYNFTRMFSVSISERRLTLTLVCCYTPGQLGASRNITCQRLPALCCNFTRTTSTSKYKMSVMLTFVWPLWNFKDSKR